MAISKLAEAWVAFVAHNVNCKDASNPNQYYATGTTLLDHEGFNKLNSNDEDVVHGVQVVYGPFGSEKDVEEFIADYTGNEHYWPGHLEWKFGNFGKPYILTPSLGGARSKVIHNKSLPFQGQLEINEQHRRIKEMEDMKKRLKNREKDNSKPIEKEELDVRIQWLEADMTRRRQEIEQEQVHLDKVISMRDSLPV